MNLQASANRGSFPHTKVRAKLFSRVDLIGWIIVVTMCLPMGVPVFAHAQAKQRDEKATQVLSAQEVETTFPPTVFFRGKTAPVQWRNASAVRFADGSLFFAGLIDSSGYASNVQETYQMYLISEVPFRIGDKPVPAGAYGAGFLGEHFVVMDVGGHSVAEGDTHTDQGLSRPRPLQILQPGALSVRLYLGRRWVSIALSYPAAKV